MDREWICIKGNKLLWSEFIYILDDYRGRRVVWERGERVSDRYNHMICVLQELTDEYHKGKDYIADQRQDWIEDYYMKMPMERKLPEALEELFEQLEFQLDIDLTDLLADCVKKSEKAYQRMLEQAQKEQERLSVVRSLMQESENIENDAAINEINRVLKLQQTKLKSTLYILKDSEKRITGLWCELLVSHLFFDKITYGQMERLVDNDLIREAEIEELLEKKYNIMKDYEWYSEDFLGCGLDEPTDIKIKDIYSICETRVKKELGIE